MAAPGGEEWHAPMAYGPLSRIERYKKIEQPKETTCIFPIRDKQPGLVVIEDGNPVIDLRSDEYKAGDVRRFKIGELVCIDTITKLIPFPETDYRMGWLFGRNQIRNGKLSLKYIPMESRPESRNKVPERNIHNLVPRIGKYYKAIRSGIGGTTGPVIGHYIQIIERGQGQNLASGDFIAVPWTNVGKLHSGTTNIKTLTRLKTGKELKFVNEMSGWGRKTRRHTKKSRKTRRAIRV
jgi:hypothetical protein